MKNKYGSCIPRFHPCKYVYYDGSKEAKNIIVAILTEMLGGRFRLDYAEDWISKVTSKKSLTVAFECFDPFRFNQGYVYVFGKDHAGFPLPISIGNTAAESIAVFDSMYKEVEEDK